MQNDASATEAGNGISVGSKATTTWRGKEIALYLFALMMLLWPLAINHAPFYSDDSPSYLRGGHVGYDTGWLILEHWWQTLFGALPASEVAAAQRDPHTIVTAAIAQSGGTRSLIYSVASYILRAPGTSLMALAVAQAGAVALMISYFLRVIQPEGSLSAGIIAAVGAAFLTSAPWYAAYASPDILAGVAMAGSIVLTVFFHQLSGTARLLLVVLIAFAITTHGSHLPVAASVLAVGGVVHFWLHRVSFARLSRTGLWFASPIVLAVAALLTTSYVAFGEASLAPKRYPILLARSVADGPGAWHLRDHCAIERYAICEIFGPNPPRKVGEFLWAANGVRFRAAPEQMERIRAEEGLIVRRAMLEYPVDQASRSLRNTFIQLFEFGLTGLRFGATLTDLDDPVLTEVRSDRPQLRAAGEITVYVSFVASLLLVFAIRRRLKPIEIAALVVAGAGLLANAAVCGILSAVTDRYQGRVAWVLPVLAIIIGLRVWEQRKEPQGRSSQKQK